MSEWVMLVVVHAPDVLDYAASVSLVESRGGAVHDLAQAPSWHACVEVPSMVVRLGLANQVAHDSPSRPVRPSNPMLAHVEVVGHACPEVVLAYRDHRNRV